MAKSPSGAGAQGGPARTSRRHPCRSARSALIHPAVWAGGGGGAPAARLTGLGPRVRPPPAPRDNEGVTSCVVTRNTRKDDMRLEPANAVYAEERGFTYMPFRGGGRMKKKALFVFIQIIIKRFLYISLFLTHRRSKMSDEWAWQYWGVMGRSPSLSLSVPP